jgi:serine/threonine protein kinase
MSYCIQPSCNRHNPDNIKFCCNCGSQILLRDRYRAIKQIGQGGFGRTFLALDEDKPSKPKCVIKQFFPLGQHPDSTSKAAELFAQEAVRLDDLGKHPRIPELLAYFNQDGNEYLIQEFIDGQNLEQELNQEGVFSESKIWMLINSLIPILQFVHENNVVHRDIKPENIIRRSDGQVVLVDFGAAKYIANTPLSVTGTVIGSAAYTAPEQARGKAVFASDLYSLGVTCLYLLTGIEPFRLFDDSENDWIWRSFLNTPVSDVLGNILDKLIQPATKKRYQSATEVFQELNKQTNPNSTGNKARSHYLIFPYAFRNKSTGTIFLKGNIEQVISYIDAHPQWLPRCILPLKANLIAKNAYSLNIGKIGALGYEIEPTVKLYMNEIKVGEYQIKTKPIADKDPNGYHVDFLSNIRLTDLSGAKGSLTRIDWELVLVTQLDFPLFITLLPTTLIQKTGDLILNTTVKQVSENFSEKISLDFDRFVKN